MTTFIILVYIVFIGFGFFLYNMFIGSSGMPVYGDRLDGIENVPITADQLSKISDELSKSDLVLSVEKPYLNGKTLKVLFNVVDNADITKTKALTDIVKNNLTKEQNAFYDIEVFINKGYFCTLEAQGDMDENGVFTGNVEVRFKTNLGEDKNIVSYGLSTKNSKDYNNKQSLTIKDDGTYTIYGFVKDKGIETTCNIKIVKKNGKSETTKDILLSRTTSSFPIIGYKRKATDTFIWTKSR